MESVTHHSQAHLFNAGRSAVVERDWQRVSQCSQRWLQRWPQHPEGHYLAGLMAGNAERFSLAAKAFERALQLDDGRCDAAVHLARCLVRLGDHRRAAQLINIAAGDIHGNAYLLDLAGSVLTHIGCHEAALGFFQKAVALKPMREDFLSNLSACALFNGDLSLAEQSLARGLEIRPTSARGWWQYSRLTHAEPHAVIQTIESRLNRWQAPLERAYGHYALGKLYEDVGDWALASDHYRAGAAQAKGLSSSYHAADETQRVDTIIELYDAHWFQQASAVNPAGAQNPLFIVGLPRTGTTLVDTILTSHGQVYGAGELQFLGLGVKQLSGVPGAEMVNAAVMRAAASLAPQRLAAVYWHASDYLAGDGRYRTDKLPSNTYYLGLIAKAFPRGKIVHVQREPMDACFAIYKQLFAGAYPFSYDLSELAHYYSNYHRLMNHWRVVLGERLIEVKYEQLVAEPEAEIRALLDKLELPFEPGCVSFYARKHTVATASAVQVREKPHSRSVGRWRHFESLMAPLRDELARQGIVN